LRRLRERQRVQRLVQVVSQPQEPEEKPKKNNYDFLKTSQIYNQDRAKEEQLKHSKAQELNLTGLDSD